MAQMLHEPQRRSEGQSAASRSSQCAHHSSAERRDTQIQIHCCDKLAEAQNRYSYTIDIDTGAAKDTARGTETAADTATNPGTATDTDTVT